MDNLLDKFGLYDFFGSLLPGMWFVTILFYIDFPLLNDGKYPSDGTLRIIIFILVCYIFGTLIQELAAFFDFKIIKMRKKSRTNFLHYKKSMFEKSELEKIKKMANLILKKKKSNNLFTNDECSRVFFECKAHLENNERMDKADKLDAIYAMSRNFVITNFFIFICTCFTIFMNKGIERNNIIIIIYVFISTFVFLERAKRYSELRVKTILRQYIDLKNK